MFEAYSRNKYASTGVIQWMLNNAWPSLIWHLYDYFLMPAGGYFGTKKACEPVHAQYSVRRPLGVGGQQHLRGGQRTEAYGQGLRHRPVGETCGRRVARRRRRRRPPGAGDSRHRGPEHDVLREARIARRGEPHGQQQFLLALDQARRVRLAQDRLQVHAGDRARRLHGPREAAEGRPRVDERPRTAERPAGGAGAREELRQPPGVHGTAATHRRAEWRRHPSDPVGRQLLLAHARRRARDRRQLPCERRAGCRRPSSWSRASTSRRYGSPHVASDEARAAVGATP